MKSILNILAGILILCGSLYSQNEVDALRYSNLTIGGTARYNSMAGAMGALGGNLSVLSSNPAGLAVYNKSEFSFSPSIATSKTQSTYLTTSKEDLKYNFNFGNFGFVSTTNLNPEKNNGWMNVNFAFSYNRLANFHNRIFIEGTNHKNSLLDNYVALADGNNYNNLSEYSTALAFNTYLIDTIPGSTSSYFSQIPANFEKIQRKKVESRGAINESVIAFSGNYDDKLYIGGAFGFPHVRYIRESSYSETDEKDTINGFKSFTLKENLTTRGSGFNFKIGLIYRPVDWVRVGASVQTPTFFSLKDEYSKKMDSQFDAGETYSDETRNGRFEYELTTPLRATGSIAFVFGKIGLISADYEVVDYSTSRLRATDEKFFDENDNISNIYTLSSNYRIGAEINLKPIVLRGGYAMYGSPYKNEINDGSRSYYSGGIGFKEKKFYIDFAYLMSVSKEDYYLYNSVPEASTTENSLGSFIMTLGFKF